ncbi:MAG TPA: alpha/beta hydrolase [Acidimicrobiales bacterium]|jgi:pimeloyl-ACP methyl ester carboxylesterase|nr:alpha/beta hydrolase [Acidimicrobiales bacterium]
MTGIVLVHGAWHGEWCWDGVVADLADRGLPAHAVTLPFTGAAADVAAARSAIEAAGPGCVVVGHSYGGRVISHAAVGLPVRRLVYLAAFLLEPGEDMLTLLDGSKLTEAVVLDEAQVRVDPAAAAEVFYGDADPEVAASLVARLRPMVLDAVMAASPAGPLAWQSIPTTYVVCTNDRALPVASQRVMAARAEAVVEWPTDHSPFVTRPAAIADLVARHAG